MSKQFVRIVPVYIMVFILTCISSNIGGAEEKIDLLLKDSTSKYYRTRQGAIERLGKNLNDKRSLKRVKEALKDKEWGVRATAIKAFAKAKAKKFIPFILTLNFQSINQSLRDM